MADRSDAQVEVIPAGAKAVKSRQVVASEDQLPLTEFTFDRAGAASPFGDDLAFPLPVAELTYVHPHPDAFPQHL